LRSLAQSLTQDQLPKDLMMGQTMGLYLTTMDQETLRTDLWQVQCHHWKLSCLVQPLLAEQTLLALLPFSASLPLSPLALFQP
jgi:hypothetical protein